MLCGSKKAKCCCQEAARSVDSNTGVNDGLASRVPLSLLMWSPTVLHLRSVTSRYVCCRPACNKAALLFPPTGQSPEQNSAVIGAASRGCSQYDASTESHQFSQQRKPDQLGRRSTKRAHDWLCRLEQLIFLHPAFGR